MILLLYTINNGENNVKEKSLIFHLVKFETPVNRKKSLNFLSTVIFCSTRSSEEVNPPFFVDGSCSVKIYALVIEIFRLLHLKFSLRHSHSRSIFKSEWE